MTMITKEEYETYSNLRYKIHDRIDKVVNIIAEVQELNKNMDVENVFGQAKDMIIGIL